MAVEDLLFTLDDGDDTGAEGLDDLRITDRSLSASVVYNTDWTVETIASQVAKGNLDLNPKFQRRDAWSPQKKSLLIESILLNFPVPPLTLAEKGGSKTYIVVDGKQRLNTISQYYGLMTTSKYNRFKLSGLQQLRELNGCDIDGLREAFPNHMAQLENYPIRTNVVRGWSNDELLYSIFLRLNSGSVKLSPQELRQALKPGPFAEFLAEYTETSPAMRSIFPGSEPDFRMRDLELMTRYLGFQFFIEGYRGDLKRFLDLTVEQLNGDWGRAQNAILRKASMMERAYAAVEEVFGPAAALRKWNGERWENRLNRAVFDIMLFYLRDETSIAAFLNAGEKLVTQFKMLCQEDAYFRSAIEVTTKSVEAVFARLDAWGHVLVDHGVAKQSVTLSDGAISYGQP